MVRVAVNPDGSVTGPSVGDHSKIPASDALARCVLDLVAGWRFPEPAADDDVELLLPFAFKPRPAAAPAADPGHGTGAKSSGGSDAPCLRRTVRRYLQDPCYLLEIPGVGSF